MEGCDTLFMVGTNFPYTKYLPDAGQCKVVQIEADPHRAGNRIPTEVPMVGDAAEGLRALAAAARRADGPRLPGRACPNEMDEWRDEA